MLKNEGMPETLTQISYPRTIGFSCVAPEGIRNASLVPSFHGSNLQL